MSTIHSSSSGKYTLLVTPGPGSWESTGTVSSGDRTIATVKRNYRAFWFLFVENHANGHDYLVCGEDYQGQTVVELDTGKVANYLPDEAADGAGFCFTGATYDARTQLLLVDGCYWAAPYEWRLYDFSTPMEKLPHIGEDQWFDAGHEHPKVHDDGTVTLYETRPDAPEDPDVHTHTVVAWRRMARVDATALKEVDAWVDPNEKIRRDEYAAQQKANEEEWNLFKATDPFYLRISEFMDQHGLPVRPYSSFTGVCHAGWHPDFEDFTERLVGRELITGFRIEWGRVKGPIVCQDDGENVYFPRSMDALNTALDRLAKRLP